MHFGLCCLLRSWFFSWFALLILTEILKALRNFTLFIIGSDFSKLPCPIGRIPPLVPAWIPLNALNAHLLLESQILWEHSVVKCHIEVNYWWKVQWRWNDHSFLYCKPVSSEHLPNRVYGVLDDPWPDHCCSHNWAVIVYRPWPWCALVMLRSSHL